MRRGQRANSSTNNQQPWSTDSDDLFSAAEDSSSASDVEADRAMKRSQKFSGSFSFEEDQQINSQNEGREPKNSCGVSVSEVVESELTRSCDTNRPRSSLFRPQELWLAMTRCLSLRWLSVSRPTNRKLVYQVDLNQSEDTQSSLSSDSTNQSSSSSSCSDEKVVSLLRRKEDVGIRAVKSCPPPRQGISRSSPGLPGARQASDLVLASMILEKEMFLRVELVDSGEEGGDFRYRAEWKLSDRTKELAEGVWLSQSHKVTV